MREEPIAMTDRIAKSALGVLPIAAFAIGGVLVAVGFASAGLVAVAFGAILAVIAAIVMAWVVLVEVLRWLRGCRGQSLWGRGMYHSVYSVARPSSARRMIQRLR